MTVSGLGNGPPLPERPSVGLPVDVLDDTTLLSSIGYQQELRRGLSAFMAFAFCFTSVSVLSSMTIQVGFGLATGGPAVMIWGWLVGSCFSILAGLSMGEICSAYPTAGSVYNWAGLLCSPPWSSLASYVTGWFNLLGNICGDAAFAYGFAQMLGAALAVGNPEIDGLSEPQMVGLSLATSVVWAVLSVLRVDQVGWISNVAAVFQLASTLGIIVTLLTLGSDRESAQFVFSRTYNDTGFSSLTYVSALGLLTTLYTFSGYEAGAHMAEETRGAAVAAPWGIVATCIAVAVTGFAYMVGLLLAMPSIEEALESGNPAAFIFVNNTGDSVGRTLILLVAANLCFAGMSSVTVTSRICFAMARDGTLPCSHLLDGINARTQTPLPATLAVSLAGGLLLLLPLVSETAFTQITALTTIGFQVSYAIPILLRVTASRQTFVQSRFHLGRFSLVVGWLSGLWLAASSVLFFLPTAWPITAQNANYAPVVVGGVLLLMAVHWCLWARHKPPGEVGRTSIHSTLLST